MSANWLRLADSGDRILAAVDTFVVFDVETTGLNPEHNELIEIAAVKVEKGVLTGRFASLIKPKGLISPQITELTGISPDMVADAPAVADVVPNFLSFAGSAVLVGHNVPFDIRFVNMAARRLNLPKLENIYIDTLQIARLLLPGLPHYRLSDLLDYFSLTNEAKHRAFGDAEATYHLLLALSAYQQENGLILTKRKAMPRSASVEPNDRSCEPVEPPQQPKTSFWQKIFG